MFWLWVCGSLMTLKQETLFSSSWNFFDLLMLGSYNPLLRIVIIRTVNVPQIKQTNKLKAQTNPLIQQTKETN